MSTTYIISLPTKREKNHNFLMVFRDQLDTEAFYNVIPCYYGWLSARIEINGSVYPCCRCYNPLGNIYEKQFDEIWNGDAYCWFRKEALHINSRKSQVKGCDCNSCVHHTANLRVFRLLHPFERNRIERLCA